MSAPPSVTTSLATFRAAAVERLRTFPFTSIPTAPGMRRAGVVLCVVEQDGVPGVIVIRRAHRGRNAGQWALPGGRAEDGETTIEAALRELHEEVGLSADRDDVLGRLDDFPAASGFAITPIVLALDHPGPIVAAPAEIQAVHHVELSRLAADDTPHWLDQADGAQLLQMRLRQDMTIHAPTGALLWQFREVVLLANPDARVAGFRQPDWTHH